MASNIESRSRPIKVMVVDDHAVVVDLLADALRDQPDITVVAVAKSVAEALIRAEQEQPDVVLMDYRLPDGDGASAAAAIRERRPETKVVILTAYADDDTLLAALEAGCSGYLSKESAFKEVVAAVRSVYEGESLISSEMLIRLLPRLEKRSRRTITELTARESEVLGFLGQGLSNPAIAAKLGLSLNTVRNHVQNVISKLGAHSKLEAVAQAAREGLITTGE